MAEKPVDPETTCWIARSGNDPRELRAVDIPALVIAGTQDHHRRSRPWFSERNSPECRATISGHSLDRTYTS
ncbi:hypothetical protein [Actinokineospora enzanensis]|uniref:hypothetical protein n=1 Tax=Actinokineospora enzanensis TaxID=155975 RepID=UPI00037830A0|nr:hypothetical protein [Actinokineospora enzanensis]